VTNLFLNKNETKKSFSINGNHFINEIFLPEDYWFFTMSQSFKETKNLNVITGNENQPKKLIFIHTKSNDMKSLPNYLRPRNDWHIRKGDYIIPHKEIRKKRFTKSDIQNLKNAFWYLIITGLVSYIILSFFVKY
jgi:hypothetical protein